MSSTLSFTLYDVLAYILFRAAIRNKGYSVSFKISWLCDALAAHADEVRALGLPLLIEWAEPISADLDEAMGWLQPLAMKPTSMPDVWRIKGEVATVCLGVTYGRLTNELMSRLDPIVARLLEIVEEKGLAPAA